MSTGNFVKTFFRKGDGDLNKKTYQSLEREQQDMIRGVVELSGTTVKEVMVPRIDTVFIDANETKDAILACICKSGHSRFPVYQDTIDNVIGVLYVKDVLTYLVSRDETAALLPTAMPFDIQKLLRKPYFVPESKHIDDLLRELRRKRVHIAVAVDEYGGVSGIVCMEDIIEEIIGDIQDEFDNETEDVIELSDSVFLCDARVNLEDLREKTGLELPVADFDTLGGFVFDLLGKIPVRYEKILFEGTEFIIQDMEGHKINSIKIVLNSANRPNKAFAHEKAESDT